MSLTSDSQDSGFLDPADWVTSCYEHHPVDDLEPLSGVLNSYREHALTYLRLMLMIDKFMASSRDGVLGWVSVSMVLQFPSTNGLTIPEIASQMEIPEQKLCRSIAGFRKRAGLDSPDTPRFYWLRARRPTTYG